jgi:hypothetical protein
MSEEEWVKSIGWRLQAGDPHPMSRQGGVTRREIHGITVMRRSIETVNAHDDVNDVYVMKDDGWWSRGDGMVMWTLLQGITRD